MKVYTMLVMAGLMCMAPAIYAQDTHMGHETTVETTKKEVHKKRMAKGKKVKPLTPEERRNLENMQRTSNPQSEPNPAEAQQAK